MDSKEESEPACSVIMRNIPLPPLVPVDLDEEHPIPMEMEVPHHYSPHPLLMDHVVENILLSLDPDLLGHYSKIFRLVSKDWCRVATGVYKRERGKIVFKGNFIGKISAMFVRTMKTSLNIPFTTFKFSPDAYDDEHFTEIIYVCGSHIETLDLNLASPCNLKFPKTFPSLSLGRLKKLVFQVRADFATEVSSLLESLMNISPNLEVVDIKVLPGSGGRRTLTNPLLNEDNVADLSNNKFGDVVAQSLPDGIRHLKLHMSFNDSQLRELTKRKLNLRTLDIYFQNSVLTKESLEAFFHKCAPNLVSCRALGSQLAQYRIQFPVFKKLKCLSGLGTAPEHIEYKRLFPELEKLEICVWYSEHQDHVFPQNCFSPTVRQIHFPQHVSSPTVIQRMSSCFPNLVKLTGITIASPEVLIAIFTWLRKLQYLSVVFENRFQTLKSLDSLMVGIKDPLVMPRYNEDVVVKEIQEKGQELPSIRNLQELRHLCILTSSLSPAKYVQVTDISVYYGFMQLKNLQSINLDFFPMSTQSLDLLQRQIRLLRPV